MTVQFANNLEFLEAVSLLVQLQTAICEEDEQQADLLRDSLDNPLKKLSWEANEWLRGLSGDLDMLCDQEVFEPNTLSLSEYRNTFLDALQNFENDPETMLVLLRKEQSFVLQDVLAYFRGRAYSLLGLHQVAKVFLNCALRLNPKNIRYKIVLLGILSLLNDLEPAIVLSRTIFSHEDANPGVILLAAGLVFQSVRHVLPVDRETLGMLKKEVEKVVRGAAFHTATPDIAAFGFLMLGAILDVLRHTTQAKGCYSRACELAPNDPGPFLLRGRLLFKTNEQKALPDFRRAVDLGVPDPFPYLILARESLKKGDYTDCLAVCHSVINIGNAVVQGQAYEFMAIAEAQKHGDTNLIRHYFSEAQRLFPSNSNLQRNLEAFEQTLLQDLNEPKHSTKNLFDVKQVSNAVQNDLQAMQVDPFDTMLRVKSSQFWAVSNPQNMPLGIAA